MKEKSFALAVFALSLVGAFVLIQGRNGSQTQIIAETSLTASSNLGGPTSPNDASPIGVSADEQSALTVEQIMNLPKDDKRKKDYLLQASIKAIPDAVQQRYGPLISNLDLTEAEKNQLADLIGTRLLLTDQALDYIHATEVTVKLDALQPASGPTQISGLWNIGDLSQVDSRASAAQNSVDLVVKDMLSSGDYETYLQYVKTADLRGVVNSFQGDLKRHKVEALTENQEQLFLDALVTANTPRRYYKVNYFADSVLTAAQTFFSPAQMDLLIKSHDKAQAQDNAIAAAVAAGKYKARR